MRALARDRASRSFNARSFVEVPHEDEVHTDGDPVPISKYRTNLTKEEAPCHCTYPFVFRGYRSGGGYKHCLKSAFELHTETINAWTMIAQGVISIALFIWLALSSRQPVPMLLPFIALTMAVLVHMPFSVGLHLFSCISKQVHDLWRRLDMTFIFLMSIPFALAMSWNVYDTWVGVTLNIGMAAVVAALGVWHVAGAAPDVISEAHKLQVFLLVSTDAVVGSFAMVYQTFRELHQWNPTLARGCTLAKVVLWQLGGWAYAHDFPEKYFPGVFDLVGSSHQLMHFAVIGAHILDYLFVWEMFCRSIVVPASEGPLTAGAWLLPVANCTVGNYSTPFAA